MKHFFSTIKAALLCGALVLGLSACGGTDSPSTTATTTTSKTASWATVMAGSGDRQVTISWDKPTTSTTSSGTTPTSTYNIYWSTDPTMATSTKITNVTSPFRHTGLTNDRTYYYVVTEVTTAGVEGPNSFVVSATPRATVPAAPVGLQTQALDGEVNIEFNGTTPANTTYSLVWYKYVGSSVSGPNETSNLPSSALSSATPYKHTALLNDGAATYQYQLKAVRNGIESKLSNPITIYPQAATTQAPVPAVGLPFGNISTVTTPGKPGRPSKVKIVAGNQQVKLDWSAASPLTATLYDTVKKGSVKTKIDSSTSSTGTTIGTTIAYDIYWDTQPINPSNPPANVIRTTGTTFTHTGLAKNDDPTKLTTYYYAVKTVAICIDPTLPTYASDFSSIASAVPTPKVPDVPSGLTIVGGTQQADLSWSKDASGLTGVTYYVYALKSATKPTVCKDSNNWIATATSNSYSHTGLMPGDTWYYCVTSRAEAESDASSIVSYAIPKSN